MTRGWKFRVKSAIAEGLYAVGILQLMVRLPLRRKAVVLTYHRVLSGDRVSRTWSHPGMVVSRETFERHLDVVGRTFRVLSFDEFMFHVESGKPFSEPSCLITFDDGWRDTFEQAWPALRRHAMPAVVFLPSQFIGSNQGFWQEQLAALLFSAWKRSPGDPEFRERCESLLPPDLRWVLRAGSEEIRAAVHQSVQALKHRFGSDDPRGLFEALSGVVDAGTDAGADHRTETVVDSFMTWEQARTMAAGGVTFGGHGVTHRLLSTLTSNEIASEVEQSKASIERELGRPAVAFSYPNGDWNSEVAGQVKRAGFRVAFSTTRGAVSSTAAAFSVPRFNMHEGVAASGPMLLARVAGLF